MCSPSSSIRVPQIVGNFREVSEKKHLEQFPLRTTGNFAAQRPKTQQAGPRSNAMALVEALENLQAIHMKIVEVEMAYLDHHPTW